MPAYTVHGGPCHYDIALCYYLFLSPRYARRHIGRLDTPDGRRRLQAECRRHQQRIERQFHEFYNPDREDGVWTLYEFPPCCSFHIDISVRLPPEQWFGLGEADIRQRLPAGCGMLIIDDLGMHEHPFAQLGGERLLVDCQSDKYTLAHEVAHNLGLPDQYRTPDVPEMGVQGNGMTPEEEAAHAGHLMGRRKNNRRAIQPHEIADIANATGMSCDRQRCCPEKAEGGREGERPADASPRLEEEEAPQPMHRHHAPPPAHAGAVIGSDVALSMLGPDWLRRFLRSRDPAEAMAIADPALTAELRRLVSLEKIRSAPIAIAALSCPVEHTLTVIGGAQVQILEPDALTAAEWTRLLDDWNARAAEAMQTYCERVAREGCRRVQPLLVTHPPRFRGRAGANGLPPHLLFIEMDIRFRCQAEAV